MKKLILLFIFSSFLASAQEKIDRSDPHATANAILTAYKAKDMKTLSSFCDKKNSIMFHDIREQLTRHEKYSYFFAGDVWNSVKKWNGSLEEAEHINFEGQEGVKVVFSRVNTDLSFIILLFVNEKWCFESIVVTSQETPANDSD